jgi:lipid II:glycine glycyltransferase (peptidoglycan interpeptide bridge formation enzyme)
MTSAELTGTRTGESALALGSAVGSGAGDTLLWPRAGVVLSPAERAWDRFVEAHPGGDVVQTAAWAQSKQATGFAVAVAVSRDASGVIAGGGLVIARRVALAGGRLPVATVGYVARGPLVTGTDAATIDRVLDSIEAAARRLGIMHLVVQPSSDGAAIAARLAQRGYDTGAMAVAPTATLVIDLAPDLDSLFAGMSASQRRNLRKARKLGVQVRRAADADLSTFHALQQATAARQGYQPLSLAYLEAQWRALRPLGAIEIFLASAPDAPERPIAGTLVTAYAGTVTDKIPGWTGEAAALQPNVACIWEAITWAKAEGFRHFDLGGLPRDAAAALLSGDRTREAHGERNPAAFKARFGGSVVLLPEALQRTFNPVLRPAVRFAWQQLVTSPRLKSFVNGLRNG